MNAACGVLIAAALPPPSQVPTLLAVGIEGCWGVVLCLVVLPILSVIRANDGLPVDDAIGAMKQIAGNRDLALAVGISVLSIAFFNFFGVSGGHWAGVALHCAIT